MGREVDRMKLEVRPCVKCGANSFPSFGYVCGACVVKGWTEKFDEAIEKREERDADLRVRVSDVRTPTGRTKQCCW